jgi:hypothetical protein
VVKNTSHPESTLKKKHLSIAYHRCREAMADGFARIGHIAGEENPADVLTKLLPGPRLQKILQHIFWWKT